MREEGPSLDRSNQLILGITNRNEQQTAVQLIHVTKKKKDARVRAFLLRH
jgi:hypothetical protein